MVTGLGSECSGSQDVQEHRDDEKFRHFLGFNSSEFMCCCVRIGGGNYRGGHPKYNLINIEALSSLTLTRCKEVMEIKLKYIARLAVNHVNK